MHLQPPYHLRSGRPWRWLLVIGCLHLSLTTGLAQPDPSAYYRKGPVETRSFANEEWASLQRELDYSGEPARTRSRPRREPTARDGGTTTRRSTPLARGDGSPLLRLLLILVLAGFGGWLLYRLMSQSDRKSNTDIAQPDGEEDISLDRIEDQLDRTDVDYYIEKAEAEGAYHLAVRLHFLAMLKRMDQAGWLAWKKDRTNRVYLRQMADHPLYAAFREATLAYERVWYGNHQPARLDYEQLRQQFLQLREQIPLATVASRA
ncbi:MAG: DUF4129 domain-containing protein [Lewinella sp.]|nr:DUF4129 domain-containing protein [Lewinella sp.]